MLPDESESQPVPPRPRQASLWRRGPARLRQLLLRRRGGAGFAAGLAVGLALGHWIVPLLSGDPGPEPGELIIVADRDSSVGKQRKALLDTWNATHPNNRARMIELSGPPEAQHAELAGRASSGEYNADIYSLDVIWMAEFAEAGYLRPLDDPRPNTAGFIKKLVDTCRFRGQLWGLPFNTDAGLLYYRTDLVAAPAMHVPQSNGKRPFSWNEIATQTGRVFASPDRPKSLVAGYVGQLKQYEGLTVNATEAAFAAEYAHGDKIDNSGVVLDSPQAPAGLKTLASFLTESDSGQPQVIARESLEADEARSTQLFRDGKVLFMRNWPVAYRNLSAQPGDGTPTPVPFDVTTLPGPSVLGGQNLAIARTSKRPRAAQELIEYLTNPRSQQLLFERGGFAATREVVYHDQSVLERYPYAPVLLAAVEEAEPRPISAHYAQFSEVFQEVALRVVQGGAPIDGVDIARLTDAQHGLVPSPAPPP